MYTLTYCGRPLHDARAGVACTAARLSQELNRADSLTVTVPASHPLYGAFVAMSPTHEVRVFDGGQEIFRGRIRRVEDSGLDGSQTLTCEGQLSYLNDTVLPHYGTYRSSEEDWEVAPGNARDLLLWYLAQHNRSCDGSQRIDPGFIGIDGRALTRSSTQAPTVGAEMRDKILDAGSGYAMCRTDPASDRRLLDVYGEDARGACSQRVEFGENLLSYASTSDGSDTVTAIRATGRRTGGAATFSIPESMDGAFGSGYHVSGGVVYSDAGVAAHGVVMASRTYDVETAVGLAQAAAADLAESATVVDSIEVSAVDLSAVSPCAEPIRLGQWVRVTARPLGVDRRMLCVGVVVDALDPTATKFTLGATVPSLTDASVTSQRVERDVMAGGVEAAKAIGEEAKAAARAAVTLSREEYAASASRTSAPGEGAAWSQDPPEPPEGGCVWRRTVTTRGDGGTETGRPVPLTGPQGPRGDAGAAGARGADGRMLVATSDTAAGTAAKVATLRAGALSLTAGASVTVVFSQANTAASPTLDVAGTGARPMRTNGTPYAYWVAGTAVSLVYDGTYWQVCSVPVYASTVTVGDPGGANVHIDQDSVDVRRGQAALASFGAGLVRLGATQSAVSMSDDALRLDAIGARVMAGERVPPTAQLSVPWDEGGAQIGFVMRDPVTGDVSDDGFSYAWRPGRAGRLYVSGDAEVTGGLEVGGRSMTPVYRLYNQYNGQHHWVTNVSEYNSLVKAGWTGEGADYYAFK